MSHHEVIGDKQFLQKKPPSSTKYGDVQAVVNSGMTCELVRYMRRKEVKVKSQPGENFKRVSTRAIADYIKASQPVNAMEDGGLAHPMDEYRGCAEPKSKMDYLILDVRSIEDFEQCHILGAVHFPKIKLNHSTNPFLPQMYTMKNIERKLIVLYDLEEESVVSIANTVFLKGIDNVAVIAGGLREFVQDYSTLITGESPVPIVPRDKRLERRADEVTVARSEAKSVVSRKPKSLSNSLSSSRYVKR